VTLIVVPNTSIFVKINRMDYNFINYSKRINILQMALQKKLSPQKNIDERVTSQWLIILVEI